ncbi:MAG: 30S ribosomal protein S9 [Candidatus Pacearchaeota archaeon]
MNNIVVTGKRKSAIAKATIKEGTGNITINRRPISQLPYLQQLEVNEPLILTHEILGNLNFDVSVNVKGGGTSSRIEASRLAIARAILKYFNNEELRRTFITYDRNMVVADTRRKEACKPGDSKARAKRQTSFR